MYSVATGWLGNPNLVCPWDEEVTNNLNTRVVTLLEGNMTMLDHGTQTILKIVIISPLGGGGLPTI